MNKFFVSLLSVFLATACVFASGADSIKYKSSNEIGWIETIPEEEGSLMVSIDGENEIEAELIHIHDADKHYAQWSFDYGNDADSFSYRLNGGPWTTIEASIKSVKTPFEKDTLNLFEIYAESDGVKTPIKTLGLIVVDKTEKANNFSLRLTSAPYSLAVYDFYNGRHIAKENSISSSAYAVTADIDLGYSPAERLRFYLGAGYSLAIKKDTVIPEAHDVHYIKAFLGVDAKAIVKGDFSLSAGLFAGAMAHINAGMYNMSSIMGARIDCGFKISDSFRLNLGTRMTAAYQPAAQPLMSSMTYLIDPLTLSLEMMF